ncbi:SGNH/GDSL hydrolase family protein [Streptomyces sp. NPDC050085]|uniref:SGNH/GDSL hydrolase family protein n=1 Tax=Streptomyces sp. NPDC050085 TaxID=3365600 RepID=UPI003799815A
MREFVRGATWWAADGRPVRADPVDRDLMPADTWERAQLPAGVRLEFRAHGAAAVEIVYEGLEPTEADALRTVPSVFAVVGGVDVAALAGAHTARVPLPHRDGVFTVQLPEGLRPLIHDVRPVGGGTLEPVEPSPRWLVYGDSIVEGWVASRPQFAWPAVVRRTLGVEDVNLGYAGAARGERVSARHLAALDAELLTVAFGTNCWARTPHSAQQLYETTRVFLATVRAGHPDLPLLVVSPVIRPDAEETPNELGATLGQLRDAVERAARDAAQAGDRRLRLLPGRPLLGPEHLVDGVHPGDRGHLLIARAVAENLTEWNKSGGAWETPL